jgi:hypothetical protein
MAFVARAKAAAVRPPELARAAVQSSIREAKRPLSGPDLAWSGPAVLTAPPGRLSWRPLS